MRKTQGVSKLINAGQKLFLVAINPSGKQPVVQIVTEDLLQMIMASEVKYGGNGKVVCEMVFDGDNLTVIQHVESMKL